MMAKEDLGLSLSLSSSSHFTTHLSLMPSSSSSSPMTPPIALPFATSLPRPAAQWNDLFTSHLDKRPTLDVSGSAGEAKSLFRGIDVNLEAEEEEAAASSPNSTISSVSGKRAERDPSHTACDELDAERASSRGLSDEEDGDGSRKKLRLSKDQSAILEESFKEHNTLNPKQKMALAKQLNLRPRQVEVWFQNRRARTKLKQTEVDCEFLKRCCENLTEENRRLQKEVQELRALKLSPQFYMHMTPPTTLTMCPSCERVSNSTSTTTSTSSVQLPSVNMAAVGPDHHHHHQYLHHLRPQAAGPWAPIALRPAFLDAPPQRS